MLKVCEDLKDENAEDIQKFYVLVRKQKPEFIIGRYALRKIERENHIAKGILNEHGVTGILTGTIDETRYGIFPDSCFSLKDVPQKLTE